MLQMVDVYHTDAGLLGADTQTGTVDIWLNGWEPPGGNDQPGCRGLGSPVCSHSRSWMYFAESVYPTENKFYARKCRNFTHFENNTCYKNEPIQLVGLDINASLTGNFYLQTNDEFPYAKDIEGATFNATRVKDEETNVNEV